MVDRALEELAALYVLGLLEAEELTAFQAKMGRDATVAKRVREFSATLSEVAYFAHAPAPPRELKDRLLEQVDTALRFRAQQHQKVSFALPTWVPWILAALLVVGCAWLGQLYVVSQSENALLRDQKTLADFELASTRNQLKAERLIIKHEVTTATGELGSAQKELAAVRQQAEQAGVQLTAAQKLIAARDLQVSLANDRITALEAKARHDADLANFKVSTLSPTDPSTAGVFAVTVWNPARQEGILRVEKLPPAPADREYQLWLVEPSGATPVEGGVFQVDAELGEARILFKVTKPIRSVARFGVTLEKKGGSAKPEGVTLLLGN